MSVLRPLNSCKHGAASSRASRMRCPASQKHTAPFRPKALHSPTLLRKIRSSHRRQGAWACVTGGRLSSWRCGDGGALLSQVKRVALTPRGPCCVADSAVARAPAPATHGGETEIVFSGQGADGGVPPALPPPPPPGMQARRRPKAGGTKLHAALAAAPAPAVAAAPAPAAAAAAARTLPAAVLGVCARD